MLFQGNKQPRDESTDAHPASSAIETALIPDVDLAKCQASDVEFSTCWIRLDDAVQTPV